MLDFVNYDNATRRHFSLDVQSLTAFEQAVRYYKDSRVRETRVTSVH